MSTSLPRGTVILTEKPSVAQDIAHAISARASKEQGYIQTEDGVLLTWAFGHLLEQDMPEDYNPAWKKWTWDTLPIQVDTWKLHIRDKAAGQLATIGKLLNDAPLTIIATDAGREGELIAREILAWHKYRGPVKRLWLQAMTKKDIQKGFAELRDGKATEGLYRAAQARQRADFLYGINGTRAATLGINQFRQMYPLGRVQTPTLYLVVKRSRDIKNFNAKEYFEVEAQVNTANGHSLTMMHAPKDEGRIFDQKVAEEIVRKVSGKTAPLAVKKSSEREAPPLPYALSGLQQDANKALSWSAQKTLDVAQAVYEKYKAISYPRTGCQYLSVAQKDDIPATLDAVRQVLPGAVRALEAAGIVTRDKVFDDSKLEDHHGLVPKDPGALLRAGLRPESDEMLLYTLVSIRYLRAIAPDMQYDRTVVQMRPENVLFEASGKVVTNPGWRAIRASS